MDTQVKDAVASPTRSAAPSAAGRPLPHESAVLHVSGTATYTDDIPELRGTVYCALGLSGKAHARVLSMDLEAVRQAAGVVAVLTAADIPGENNGGPVLHDDPLLADGLVQYRGQPLFAVVATSSDLARRAARLARVEYDALPATRPSRQKRRERAYCRPCACSAVTQRLPCLGRRIG